MWKNHSTSAAVQETNTNSVKATPAFLQTSFEISNATAAAQAHIASAETSSAPVVGGNRSWNGTYNSDVCINNESWGFIVTALTSSLIIGGNLLVIAVIIRFPSRRFRALNWLICQLAVADLSIGFVVLWIGTLSTLLMETVSLMNSLVTYGLLASFTSTSTLGVLLIAVDRYFYVIRHSEYRRLVTRRRLGLAIGAAFAVPFIVFVAAPAAGWNCIDRCDCSKYNLDPNADYCLGEHCSQMMTPFTTEYVLTGGLCLLTLLVASVIIYSHIFQRVHSHTSELGSSSMMLNSNGSKKRRQLKKTELKMVRTMIIVLCGFILTTGPLATVCLASYGRNRRQMHFVMRGLVVMSTLNSILNPIFYFWRIPEMSSKLRKMMAELRCCKLVRPSAQHQSTMPGRSRRLSSFQVRLHWVATNSNHQHGNNRRNRRRDEIANTESSVSANQLNNN